MTQSPQSGQAAPRTTGLGSLSAPQHGGPSTDQTAPPAWSPAGYPPASASADSPTGTLPQVRDAAPAGKAPVAASPPGTASAPTDGGKARSQRSRGPRRARLQLRHINPWTVLKFSCVLSIALFFVWLIVVGVLFGILDGAGIIGKINDTITTIQGGDAKAPVTAGIVFGGAAIIGVVDVVLFIALSTIGSLVYNLCADLVGGIEVTLSER